VGAAAGFSSSSVVFVGATGAAAKIDTGAFTTSSVAAAAAAAAAGGGVVVSCSSAMIAIYLFSFLIFIYLIYSYCMAKDNQCDGFMLPSRVVAILTFSNPARCYSAVQIVL
jgi:hypothetical protein